MKKIRMKKIVSPLKYGGGYPASYSRSIRVGNLVFLSGAGSRLISTGFVDPAKRDNAAAQVKDCMDKIKAALEDVQSSLEHIVKVTIYIKDIGKDGEGVVDAYVDYIRQHAPSLLKEMPCQTAVGVNGTFQPEMLLEIDVFAIIPE